MRKILSRILKYLSKWALAKHASKIIVLAGPHGTSVTGELLAEMMSNEYVVRRQLQVPFWDFSIPLAILGIDDKRYSVVGWLKVILRVVRQLVMSSSSFSWIILQMNTNNKNIARYWLDIISPDICVLVNTGAELRLLEKLLVDKTKDLIVTSDNLIGSELINNLNAKVFVVGKNPQSSMVVKKIYEKGKFTVIESNLGEKMLVFKALQKGEFLQEPVLLSLATRIGMGGAPAVVQIELSQAELNIENFISSVG